MTPRDHIVKALAPDLWAQLEELYAQADRILTLDPVLLAPAPTNCPTCLDGACQC